MPVSASAARGSSDSKDASRNGDIVAICDIDDNTLGKAGENYAGAKKFNDFRKMLEEVGPNIDAVTISTPDHTHAAATIMALKMGKHCYTQKPLTHAIYEARRMGEVAREMKVVTQMGNQGTANYGLREAAATIKVRRARQCQGSPRVDESSHLAARRRPPGRGRGAQERPLGAVAGPSGVSPHANGYHPFAWRGFSGFRHRRPGRHGLPHDEHALHVAGPEEPGFGRSPDFGP